MNMERSEVETYDMETVESIGNWADTAFGPGTVAARSERLLEEVEELCEAPPEKVAEELADCAIVLFTIAHTAGVDLWAEVAKKMKTNRARKWKRTTTGCGQHVEEGSEVTP